MQYKTYTTTPICISTNYLDGAVALETTFGVDAWNEDQLKSELAVSSYVCMAIDENDKLVGYLAIRNNTYIWQLVVSPQFQNRGIGERLIKYAQQCHHNYLELHVRPSNETALHLYEKCGFAVTDTVPNYYGNEDGLILSWKFR